MIDNFSDQTSFPQNFHELIDKSLIFVKLFQTILLLVLILSNRKQISK